MAAARHAAQRVERNESVVVDPEAERSPRATETDGMTNEEDDYQSAGVLGDANEQHKTVSEDKTDGEETTGAAVDIDHNEDQWAAAVRLTQSLRYESDDPGVVDPEAERSPRATEKDGMTNKDDDFRSAGVLGDANEQGKTDREEKTEGEETTGAAVDIDHNEDQRVAVVRLVPRQRYENNAPVVVDLATLMSRYHMRLPDAAKSLRISETTLKHVCRKLGVARWPRRMMTRETEEGGQGAGEGAGAATAGSRKGGAVDVYSEDGLQQGSASVKRQAEAGAERGAQRGAQRGRHSQQSQRPHKSQQMFVPMPTTVGHQQHENFSSQWLHENTTHSRTQAHPHPHHTLAKQAAENFTSKRLERQQIDSNSSQKSGSGGSKSSGTESPQLERQRTHSNSSKHSGAGGSQSSGTESQGSGSGTPDSIGLPHELNFDRVLRHLGRGASKLAVEQNAREATAFLDDIPN